MPCVFLCNQMANTNSSHLETVCTLCTPQVLITKVGEIDATQYLDPKQAQTFTFDHVKQVRSSGDPRGCVAALECYVPRSLDDAGLCRLGASQRPGTRHMTNYRRNI